MRGAFPSIRRMLRSTGRVSDGVANLTRAAWDRLCDGCGRCCVHKIDDPAAGLTYYTNVACRLLDLDTGRCLNYRTRRCRVPECVDLYARRGESFDWLPSSCAYRLLAAGFELPAWHPVRTGTPDSTRRAGMSIVGHAVPESDAGPLERHIISWEPLGQRPVSIRRAPPVSGKPACRKPRGVTAGPTPRGSTGRAG